MGAGREKFFEILQLHSSHSCLDKVVHTPVLCNDRCQDGSDAVAVRLNVVDARVMQVQFLWFGRPCDHAETVLSRTLEGASESVHRQVWWTSQFVQRRVLDFQHWVR